MNLITRLCTSLGSTLVIMTTVELDELEPEFGFRTVELIDGRTVTLADETVIQLPN